MSFRSLPVAALVAGAIAGCASAPKKDVASEAAAVTVPARLEATPEECTRLSPLFDETSDGKELSFDEALSLRSLAVDRAEAFYLYQGADAASPGAMSLGARVCGKMVSLWSPPADAAYEISPDRKWAVWVSLRAGRASADAPRPLARVRVTIVELASLYQPQEVEIDPEGPTFESISVAISSDSTLHVRLRNVSGSAQEERRYAQCRLRSVSGAPGQHEKAPEPDEEMAMALRASECELTFGASDPGFPAGSHLEVTARSAYRVEPVPAGFTAENLVPRTFHLSPDGKWAAYTVVTNPGAQRARKYALHLRELASGRDEKLAQGSVLFHGRWLDSARFEHELDVAPSELLTTYMKAVREGDQYRAVEAEVNKLEGEDRKANEALLEGGVFKKAMQAALMAGVSPALLVDAPVARVTVGPSLRIERLETPFMRLWTTLVGLTDREGKATPEVPAQ
jgi:hypothetical protein